MLSSQTMACCLGSYLDGVCELTNQEGWGGEESNRTKQVCGLGIDFSRRCSTAATTCSAVSGRLARTMALAAEAKSHGSNVQLAEPLARVRS